MPKRTEELPTDEKLQCLIEAVERVGEELNCLYRVLDQIRDDFGWALNNDRFRTIPEAAIVTSLPRDPLAPDWNERMNRITPRERAEMAAAIAAEAKPNETQRDFW